MITVLKINCKMNYQRIRLIDNRPLNQAFRNGSSVELFIYLLSREQLAFKTKHCRRTNCSSRTNNKILFFFCLFDVYKLRRLILEYIWDKKSTCWKPQTKSHTPLNIRTHWPSRTGRKRAWRKMNSKQPQSLTPSPNRPGRRLLSGIRGFIWKIFLKFLVFLKF